MSENHKTQESVQQEKSTIVAQEKHLLLRNANILGFNVPHWVLIALLLIVVFYLYRNGSLKNLFSGTQNVTIADKTVLMQQTGVTDGVQTPDVVKRLLNKYY